MIRAQRRGRAACASPPTSTRRSRTARCSSSPSARRPTRTARADMQYVLAAARNIGRRMTEFKIVVDKSTVPVGTADRVRAAIAEELARARRDDSVRRRLEPGIPEGGRGGRRFHAARPHRDRRRRRARDRRAARRLRAVQRNHERLLVMDVRSAELTKYAANAMLATRISFMNELANLADELGADIEHVRQGIGSDPRIGYHFLYPGVGYGGSCFPKDVKALQHTATQHGRPLRDARRRRSGQRRAEARAGRQDRRAPRRRPRRPHVRAVGPRVQAQHRRHARGAVARDHRRARRARRDDRRLRSGRDARGAARASATAAAVAFAASPMAALDGADALVVVTEWKEFRSPDFDAIRARAEASRSSSTAAICTSPAQVRAAGLEYFAHRPPLMARASDFRCLTAAVLRPGATRVARTRVLVVGDVMLDRYWFGDVERISPEAPVPVVKIARSEERPGGAANVARNAAALGAQATLLSVTGDDEAGRDARAAARRRPRAHVVPPRSGARDDGQAARHRPPAAAAAHRFRDRRRRTRCSPASSPTTSGCSPTPTSSILSDYGKGGLAHIATMIERARAAGQAGAGRSEGRRLDALSRRDADHAQSQRIPRRSSDAGATRRR